MNVYPSSITLFPRDSILGVLALPVSSSSSATIVSHCCFDEANRTVVFLLNDFIPLAVEKRCGLQSTILALSFSVKLQRDTKSSADPLSTIHVRRFCQSARLNSA